MNAIKFLINEHDKVRKLMSEISDNSHKESIKKMMFDQLCHELVRHETMEHTIWYPKFEDIDLEVNKIVNHLITEEKKAEQLMKEFKDIKLLEKWEEKYFEFKNEIEHHANEEEEKLFPKIETFLSFELLNEIGKEMKEFKKEAEE